MAIHVALHHRTTYRYDRTVTLSPQVIRLRPAPHCRTPILSYSLTVRPDPHFLNWQQDPQGNLLARVVFPEKVQTFEVEVDLTADMTVINPFDFFLEPYAENFSFSYEAGLAFELEPFLSPVAIGDSVRQFLDAVDRRPRKTIDFLVDLNRQVKTSVEYETRMAPGVQAPEETLVLGRGSCRDSTWLLVAVLRELGLAARFASGYLVQLVADVASLDGPSGSPEDFTDLHAWAEVYLPGAGWVGLDATSGLLAGEGHIPLACAPSPTSAAPITGAVEPCKETFDHAISVTRIREHPRVTKPYADREWAELTALGRKVDDRLAAGDVRLSIGGAPTFVSLDDKDGAEWNMTVTGPTKRRLCVALLRALKEKWAPGGLLYFVQEKGNMGASSPEGALCCFWKRDGEPLWHNPVLLADNEVDHGHTTEDARRVIDLQSGSNSSDMSMMAAVRVETRNGTLRVVLPPVESMDAFIKLVAAVEAVLAEASLSAVIGGPMPPEDPRVAHFDITADPGVIRVNTPPIAGWNDLVANTETLYEVARQSRLVAERFDLDGKHTGTGGGSYIILSGPTPLDSPFLRRPALLKSLVGLWHNHPALSYLFSTRFIGPDGQAPRVDEGRRDAVYELELAFQRTPSKETDEPGLVDRLYRHLLVDKEGNTYRAEFCIDKLYPPHTASDQQGLVALRAFEMPPHPQMSSAQQLLVRALVAMCWEDPYKEALVRWGTQIHDRFLLPHFVWEDFRAVLWRLNAAGFEFSESHFAPHFEFRFPFIGEAEVRGIHLELREAIEPWYILRATSGADGTSRFMDSSVERLQVKVDGYVTQRYAITCNGRQLPLFPTGTNGQFAAGVRYRAWQPPHGLHPTIPVDTPLVFDVIDKWSDRSLGGCRYHVTHPGGRSYETLPLNAAEAESRRAARFFKMGHTPGSITAVPVERLNPDFPMTLDLRRLPENPAGPGPDRKE